MNTQSPLFKTIAHVLIAVMWAQPLHSIAANLQVDHQGGGNTHITSANNGVPVVNIATPNGKGLSHNKFTDYNVSQQGLILNNSTDKLTSTQLGGIIFGNSQLGGKAANTILNEVTGGQRSQLKGYTEVAGQQAHVIVANPHGITCDGCGFINTPHATLTTGQPMLEQGQLQGYDVNGGDIEIAGAGLNASNISRFDLITRSAKINAELHANELNIITGRNQVEAGTLKATAKTDTTNDQPLLAIDSSALGGMYAGAIRLVGTEAGVGVKLAGDMAASAGDIRIDANGKLTLARVSASNGLHIKVADEVELTRQAYAGKDVNITADALKNQGSLLAGQTIIIDADRTHNTGLIEAGVNADASLNNNGRVQMRGAELTNSGSMVASRELDVKATRQLNNRTGQLVSDGDLRLNAGQLDNRQGLMTAAGSTRITAGHIDNRNRGEISSQQQLSVKADQLDNSDAGRLIGEASVSVQADALDNQSSGVVATAGSLSVTANRLDNRNQGLLKGAQGVSITTESLDNQNGGLVISDSQLRMEAQQIKNRAGVIDSRDKLTLVAEQLDNQSGEITGGGDVRIQGVELDNREGGVIASSGDLNVEAGMFNNRYGNLVAGAELVVKGDSLDNTDGHITSQDMIELQHQELDNTRGVVAAGTQLEVTAGHVDNEAGELSAGQLLTLEGHTLQQAQGRILSGGRMSLNTEQLDNSGQGLISAATSLEVRAKQLNNQQGVVISDGTLTVQAGQLNNHNQGLLASKGVLRIQATGLDQHDRGELISEQALHLELSGGDLDNSRGGLIYAPELYLQGVASLDNSQGGEISTPADLVLSAARLDNSAGLISSGQTLHVRVGTLLRNTLQGLLTAARDLQIEAQAIDNRQQGTLMGRNNVTVQAQTLDNRQQGAVLAGKQLKMTVTDLDNSHEGLINSQQTLHISSARLNNSDGAELSSQRQLVLNTETLDNRQGQLVSDGTLELTQSGPLLDNRGGLIHAVGDLSLNNLQQVNNSQGGEISSQNTLQLTLETLDNTHGGVVISSDQLRVIADSIDNRDQGLLSGYTGLSVLTRYLDNQGLGTLSSRQGVLQVQVGEHLDNSQQGALVSQHALNVQAGSLNNQHGIVSSTDDVTLQLDGQLDSGQGQIAGKNITITATQLDNTAGEISAEQALTLKGLSQVWNRQGGRMLSGSALLLQADMIDNQTSVLASEGWLSLIASQLINRQHGGIAANQTLDIQAQHIDNHNQSQIYSQQAGVELKTDTFSNHDGLIQARADLNLEIAGHASNQEGRLLSEQGAVTLQATTLDNHAGVLASLLGQLKVVVQGLFGNQSGTVQGRSVVVQAAELANQSGHMAATAGDFALSTTTLNNRGGGLYAHKHLALAADMLDNSNHGQIAGQTLDFSLSGSLNNQSGLIEAETLQLHSATLDNRDGRLRALAATGHSHIVSEGGLDNRNGLIEIANQHFTLDAPELSNQAGQIVHAGSGQFDLLSGQARQVGGSVTSRGHVTLSSDTWENSTRFEAGALNLHVGHFTQTSSGQLIASQSLTATGDTWVNHGLIASDGDLSLTLSNSYSGSGQLVSLGDLDLFAPQLTVAAQGLVYGAGHTRIQGQQLTNRGNISPAGSLSIDVQQLTNRGTLGSAGMLDIKASGIVNEEGLIFSGDDMRLRVGQLSNRYADIYSLGNIDLAGVETGAQAQRVDNISASMEALGDFTLRSALIENRRDVLEVRESGKYSVVISELPCHGPYRLGDCDLGSNGRRNAAWLVTEREKLNVVASSAASRLQAGGHLSVYGESLLNSSSQISSGKNLLLSVGQLTNQGVKPADIETQRVFTSGRKPSYYYYRDLANNFNAKHVPQVQQGSVEYDLSTFISRMENEYLPGRQTIETPLAGEEYSAIIQAAGQVTIDARQSLENSVIRPGYRYIGGGNRVSVQEPGSTHGTDVQVQAQLPLDQQQKQLDPTTLPDFSLPSGDNGLFRLSDQGAHNQTVQAQEGALTSGQGASRAEQLAGQAGPRPGQYEPGYPLPGHPLPGADYTASAAETLLAELQSLQDQNTSHNYLVETNPALTQMRQFLSSDYLLGGLGLSPDSMQKRLGDGLYEQKLMREAWVARTGQRFIAGLDSDEAMFRYLMDNAIASKEALNLSVGISLSAEQVAALTHDIVWMEEREVMGEKVLVPVLYMAQAEGRLAPNGALIQGQDLTLISGGDLSNQGTLRATNSLSAQAGIIDNSGLIQAGERLSLLAEDSLYNRQGGILAGRDVDLTARTGDILNERSITRHESALGTSRWETSFADNAARIEAANGLSLNAGRDVLNLGGVLNSGGDMQITAGRDVSLSSVEERHSISRGSHYLNSQTTQLISETVAGGNLMIDAGRDLAAVASRIESGQHMQLVAGNDLTLASAADESHHYSKSKKRTSQRDLIQQQGTEVVSGGQFAAVAGNDLTLIASSIAASNEAYLVAGGKVQLLAEQDIDYSFSEKKKKGSFGRKSYRMSESDNSTAAVSSVQAGTDLLIHGAEAVVSQGAQLQAVQHLELQSGGDILLLAAENSSSQASAKSKSGLLSSKGKASSQSQTQVVGTTADAGSILIAAGQDLQVSAGDLRAQGDMALQAGRDVELSSAMQYYSSQSQSKHSSKLGFSHHALLTHTQKQQAAEQGSGTAVGSYLSADNLLISSGRDTDIQGSTLISERDMRVSAGRDLHIGSAENTSYNATSSSSKKTGEIGSWWQPATGQVKQKVKTQGETLQQSGSELASLAGNIHLQAGETYQQTASGVLALEGDIHIQGKQVNIEAGYDQLSHSETRSANRTAVGGTVSIPIVNAIQSMQQVNKARERTDDPRMQALAAVTLAMQGKAAYDGAQALYNGNVGGIKISLNLSNNNSRSHSIQQGQNVSASSVIAGGDIHVQATGAQDSDLNIIGSRLSAEQDIKLAADRHILLRAAENTATQSSKENGGGWSVGVGFGLGGSQNGFTLELAANQFRGTSDGNDSLWSNTQVEAGRQVHLESGADTRLQGAVVKGEQVTAEVGGNLLLESLQDRSTYQSKQSSSSAGVSLCIPPFCAGTSTASASQSSSKAQGDYASVNQQTGIQAGDGGFQLKVNGRTDLTGAVIASSEQAVQDGLNRLETGTLVVRDIENHAQAKASSNGLSLSSDMLTSGKYGIAKGVIGNELDRGAAKEASSGHSLSAISDGEILIKDEADQLELTGQSAEETLTLLRRDTDNTHTAAERIDIRELERDAEAQRIIKQAIFAEAVKFTDETYRVMFLEDAKVYAIERDEEGKIKFDDDGNTVVRELSPDEKKSLGSDGKRVKIFNNGIFNIKEAAEGYAAQMLPGSDEQVYLIHFPAADNAVSELLVAGYQKFLENDFWGLANATLEAKDMMRLYGETGLDIAGHSRGSMTLLNAMQSLQKEGAVGSLSETMVHFFGPAANAQTAAKLLYELSGGKQDTVYLQNHKDDFVGTILGGNPATYDKVPEGSNKIKEWINMFNEQPTVHSCYGGGAPRKCEKSYNEARTVEIKR